jgi:hypothetical protein
LDVVVGRRSDLQLLVNKLASHRLDREFTENNEKRYAVVGDWRTSPGAPPVGYYEMDISADGDFRRFSLEQMVAIPGRKDLAPVRVKTVWDSSLKVDGEPNKSLFTVITN